MRHSKTLLLLEQIWGSVLTYTRRNKEKMKHKRFWQKCFFFRCKKIDNNKEQLKKRIFCRKHLCFLLFCHLGESISLDLFYFVNLTSSCSFIPPCTLSHVKTSETLWFLVSENWDTLTLSLMESGETLLARSCVKTGETLWLLAIWKPWDTDWDALNQSNLENN